MLLDVNPPPARLSLSCSSPSRSDLFFLNRRKPSLNTVMENAGRPALYNAMMNVVVMSVWLGRFSTHYAKPAFFKKKKKKEISKTPRPKGDITPPSRKIQDRPPHPQRLVDAHLRARFSC